MIIRDVIPDQTAQMNVIEDNQVIEKLSATASDPAFSDSILPRACRAYVHTFYAARPQHIGNLLAKLGITIQDRVAYGQDSGKASLSCCTTQGPVGCSVTLKWRILRRSCSDDEETIQDSKVRVGTVKKSMAVMTSR
jgi:hypothetical protein